MPSRCFEGGPTVVHEAFAAGTPVVGTRIGAMPELIRDRIDGRLLTPGSVSEIKEAIREIAADPAGTVDAWRRALPMPRTMDDIADDYEKLYFEVIKRKKPQRVIGTGGHDFQVNRDFCNARVALIPPNVAHHCHYRRAPVYLPTNAESRRIAGGRWA